MQILHDLSTMSLLRLFSNHLHIWTANINRMHISTFDGVQPVRPQDVSAAYQKNI